MAEVDTEYADVVEWRRDFHAHPELQFEVHRAAGLVATKLREFGCDEVVTGVGKTGVVGGDPWAAADQRKSHWLAC